MLKVVMVVSITMKLLLKYKTCIHCGVIGGWFFSRDGKHPAAMCYRCHREILNEIGRRWYRKNRKKEVEAWNDWYKENEKHRLKYQRDRYKKKSWQPEIYST